MIESPAMHFVSPQDPALRADPGSSPGQALPLSGEVEQAAPHCLEAYRRPSGLFFPPPERGRAIAYDTTFRFVIPAERRQAREPGPKNPCLGLISDAGILGSRIGSLRPPARVATRKAGKKFLWDCPPV